MAGRRPPTRRAPRTGRCPTMRRAPGTRRRLPAARRSLKTATSSRCTPRRRNAGPELSRKGGIADDEIAAADAAKLPDARGRFHRRLRRRAGAKPGEELSRSTGRPTEARSSSRPSPAAPASYDATSVAASRRSPQHVEGEGRHGSRPMNRAGSQCASPPLALYRQGASSTPANGTIGAGSAVALTRGGTNPGDAWTYMPSTYGR
jgi:hypothetical protein